MAITTVVPIEAEDLVTFEEASRLLAETGHPAPPRTLRRWAREEALPTVKFGRSSYASFSDILVVHAAKVRARHA